MQWGFLGTVRAEMAYRPWDNWRFFRRCIFGFTLHYFRRCICEFDSIKKLGHFVNFFEHVVDICLGFITHVQWLKATLVRLGLVCVSQTTSVQCERVSLMTMRPRVTDNVFDVAPTSGAWSSGSRSQLSQTSQAYEAVELEVSEGPVNPEAQEEVDRDSPLESYPRGSYGTSLLYNYAEHAARHVWNREVYFFSFSIHFLSTN